MEEIKEASKKTIKICLVGNKIDAKQREVTEEEGKRFAKENDLLFYEVSAKTGDNINEMFEQCATYVLLSLDENEDENELKVKT